MKIHLFHHQHSQNFFPENFLERRRIFNEFGGNVENNNFLESRDFTSSLLENKSFDEVVTQETKQTLRLLKESVALSEIRYTKRKDVFTAYQGKVKKYALENFSQEEIKIFNSESEHGYSGGKFQNIALKRWTKELSTGGRAEVDEVANFSHSEHEEEKDTYSPALDYLQPNAETKEARVSQLMSGAQKASDENLPYKWGEESLETGADCSGFTQSLYAGIGIHLPRTAYTQSKKGRSISPEALQPGDLIFFKTDFTRDTPVTHVAMYIGNGEITHAASKKQGCITHSFDPYASTITGMKRYI